MTNEIRSNKECSWIPLSEWRVRNFKSIANAELQLAPLTLLVGPNSSGKSSIIQSILLVVQAAQEEAEGATFPLNGSLVSLGEYKDVRFKLAKSASVSLGGSFSFSEQNAWNMVASVPEYNRSLRPFRRTRQPLSRGTADLLLSFDRPSVDEPASADISAVGMKVDLEDEGMASVELAATRRGEGELPEDLERIRIGKLAWPTQQDFALGFDGTLKLISGEQDIRGLALRASIPHNVVTTWQIGTLAAHVWVETRTQRPLWRGGLGPGPKDLDEGDEPLSAEDRQILTRLAQTAASDIAAWNEARKKQATLGLPSYLSSQDSLVSSRDRLLAGSHTHELIDEIVEKLELGDVVYAPAAVSTASALFEPAAEIRRFLSERVVYLGPLREDPRVTYRSSPAGATGYIGSKGEYMASVLHARRSREVVCPFEDGSSEQMRLADALEYWVTRLELADSVATRDLGRLGLQVSVSRGRVPDLDLTSVGVGVSQLLPVVVMCLLSPPGSLILLEQPELHLHPALQQKLGDFFIACSRGGRQLLVETHSEHLVTRLRRRVAEDEGGELLRQVAVIFAQQSDGESRLYPVELNELGGIDDWPPGFFDQFAQESKAILQAGLGKKLRAARLGDGAAE